jgi:hypothetical protein
MQKLTGEFKKAAKDYLYLLEKGYPQKSILKLVGDRYQLHAVERSILYRGIVPESLCETRLAKLTNALAEGEMVGIDGYNVVRTVGSYLLGKTVFISSDGFVRDAAEMHRAILKGKPLNQSIQLLLKFLQDRKVGFTTIYLDEPISKSGELAARLNESMPGLGLSGEAKPVHSPDHHLKKVNVGVICTADSIIIDECKVPVFDLARAILEENYSPDWIDLQEDKR